jgi:hypothetical protein
MSDLQQHNEEGESQIDVAAAKWFESFSKVTSRRGFVARAGQVMLKILGVSLVPLLPVDRAFGQSQNCNGDPAYCGQYGAFCKSCCGDPALATSCPRCLFKAHSWTFCCCFGSCPNVIQRLVTYYDCCGVQPGYTASQTAACEGAWCLRAPPQQYWCMPYPNSTYRCTIVSVSSTSCTNCLNRC